MSFLDESTKSAAQSFGGTADNPPKTPLVLRVGVAGHRPDPRKRPNPDEKKLRELAGAVFRCINDAFSGVAETYPHVFDGGCQSNHLHRQGTLRVISALAAGPDQWLAEEAIAIGYELQAPLPFTRDEYRHDFDDDHEGESRYNSLLKKATAVLELDGKVYTDAEGHRNPDSGSYQAVGRIVLDQSDILVAIWDGEDSQGKGGTAQVVNEALQRGIPVVSIRWAAGAVWEILEPKWRLLRRSTEKDGDWDRLVRQVRELLIPPESCGGTKDGAPDLRQTYFKEVREQADISVARWPEEWNESTHAKSSAPGTSEPGVRPELINQINGAFLTHYAWANGLSVYYARRFRRSYWSIYLLGAFAVFFALIEVPAGEGWIALAGTAIELGLIAVVLGLTYWGRRQYWHERWIDYRTLAERLRLARFLALLGGGGQQVSLAGHLANYGNPASTWMHWHYRAIERAAGLSTAVFSEAYLNACQTFWCNALIDGQIQYHATNRHRFENLDRRLHLWANSLFGATLIVCGVHLAWSIFESPTHSGSAEPPAQVDAALGADTIHQVGSSSSSRRNAPHPVPFDWRDVFPKWLIIFAAFFPALGGAYAAIRSQGEYHRVARRSMAMSERLAELKLEMASVATRPNELNSVQLRQCAEEVSRLMINEMLDWRVVFQDRPLSLPA